MKNINKKTKNPDPLAEVKRSKNFQRYSKEAEEKIRLGVEIYNTREILKMSQQELAKKAQTTQKVISRLESGDVNVGFALLNRIASALNFNYKNWSEILGFSVPAVECFFDSRGSENNSRNKKSFSSTISSEFIN